MCQTNNNVIVLSLSGEDVLLLSAPTALNQDVFPTLSNITDIISTNIPSLARVAAAIGGSTPSAPPPVDNLAESVSTNIAGLAEAAKTVANPAAVSSALSTPAAHSGVPTLDSIIGSMTNMPSLAGISNNVANSAVSSAPSAPPISTAEPSRDMPTGKPANQLLFLRSTSIMVLQLRSLQGWTNFLTRGPH